MHIEFKLLNTLILSSFLIIVKLEALGLIPHQDFFGRIPVTKSFIFCLIYHGKFQTYSKLKQ